MFCTRRIFRTLGPLGIVATVFLAEKAHSQAPVVVNTNVSVRVMASNLSSGNNQRYETAGLNILKALKPDIVAMQEFNVSNSFGINTAAALRSMVDTTFGTNFVYYRESSASETYTIPNGVISRYPMITNGSWNDVTSIADRGFAWARIDVPGADDLYVVSVHLKASSGSSAQRAIQATNLTALIQSSFPSNAWIIVAGDFNIGSSGETALAKFKTYLSDNPIPTDGFSNASTNLNTSEPRSERYDYVLPSFSLTNILTDVIIGTHTFPKGLVFDSDVYTPLSEVSPVAFGDSHGTNMQHMGVVKDFRINYTVTNFVTVPSPTLALNSTNILRWQGVSNVIYSVQASTNLPTFSTVGTAVSATTNVSFTNQGGGAQRFFRVVYP